MISDRKNMWKSNLMLSDIPWDYYLHPCPTLYAKELSMFGPTLWVNPPTRNPAKAKLIFKKQEPYRLYSYNPQKILDRFRFRQMRSSITD